GQSHFLVRALGERRACELMWSARRFDAHEAKALGLVERVVTVAEFDDTVEAEVERLASGPRHGWAEIKRLLNTSGQPLAQQLADEAAAFGRCAATQDFAEAVTAFIARRTPKFEGR
ncbi:MAG: enoyl-CoA hydratase, partial [Methyloversatilis sp.]|nr:enoyl-CoA hydratase [Methyloversatilis sp.]